MAKGQFKDCGDPQMNYIITMNVNYYELLSLDQMKVT